MNYRKFGNTGREVSEIGFGAWAIGGSWGDQKEEDSLKGLETALDRGLNFIDTAAGYGDQHRHAGECHELGNIHSLFLSSSCCTRNVPRNTSPA